MRLGVVMKPISLIAVLAVAILAVFQNCSPVKQNDGLSFVFPQRAWSGVKQFGVQGSQVLSNSLAIDPFGNVYSGGTTNGRIDTTSPASVGAFIQKFDRAGQKDWARLTGVDGFETEGIGIATDANNVYIVGWTNAGNNGNALQGNIDILVAKFSSGGVRHWTKQFGTAGATAEGLKVAIDSSLNIVIVGFVTGQLEGATAVGNQDLFVMKLDSSGNKKFVRQYGVATKITAANAVAIDSQGNILIAGSTNGAFDGNAAVGIPDAIVAKLDANGNLLWSKQFGAVNAQTQASGIAVDSANNAYVTGTTTGNIETNIRVGLTDSFIAKFRADGLKVFVKQAGFAGTTAQAFAIAADRTSNVYMVGSNLGDPATTFNIAYLMKYDSSGNRLSLRQFNAPNAHVLGTGVATDTALNVYFGGQTGTGLGSNVQTGAVDSFIYKFDSQGLQQ